MSVVSAWVEKIAPYEPGKPLDVSAGSEDVNGYVEKYPHKIRVN